MSYVDDDSYIQTIYTLHTVRNFVLKFLYFSFVSLLSQGEIITLTVRYHCGGWPEEVNTCFLNSYMVYL